ncbi:phosphoribosylformylglycinamidine cyclo-ligase [Pelagibacteraceae bacterium]|jgi:phosphoribosylformylglycinamidine cyclo-ligase|nr:phosphoribosylformylglycinamidine cyclo-ligase [Pelagibacteraceae bacterium]MDC1130284.1 phosphoribosylformylglycinamidine cyclo-ligase [Pelagibacteraceae bacterium]
MKKIKNSYKKSGVDISLANKLVRYISNITKKDVKIRKNSFNKEVIGGFGSLFDISKIKIKDPVIVSCTDGVGTKIDLANKYKKFDTIGIDLVAMCVNDLIVQGAKPLFFLDYIAVGKLNLVKMKNILKGIFDGCRIADCKLIGGETAEMPGIYSNNKFDLAGFSVGIVSKRKILHKNNVLSKNVILAIPSSGIHSNGYSLVRSILKNNKIPNNLKKEILRPTKIYSKEILKLTKKNLINSAAHITGGGLVENLMRSIPENLTLNIDLAKIKTLKIFKWLKTKNITDQEMIKTFNCGVGFCLIVEQKNVSKIKKIFSKQFKPYEIGFISKTKERVKVINCIKW